MLLSNGRLVSTNGSAAAVGDMTDIIKVQAGLHVLAGHSDMNAQLFGLSRTTDALTGSTLDASPVSDAVVSDGATSPDAYDRVLVDLGGGRIMVIWVADTGTVFNDGTDPSRPQTDSDGIYAAVYNMALGGFEADAALIKDFGQGGLSFKPTLAAIDLEADVLADGRVQLSWAQANGLSGMDILSTIIDARGGPIAVSGTALTGHISGSEADGDMVSYAASASGVRVDLINNDMNRGDAAGDSYTGVEHIVGTAFNDQLWGANNVLASETLDGGAGNDQLAGRGGDDNLNGGDGNDSASGGTGNDHVFGDAGDDVLYGNDGSDHMDGGSGNDFIAGGFGDDTIDGGAGNDLLSGGTGDLGDDIIDGGDGNDVITGGDGYNIIDGGAGVDTLSFAGLGPTFVDLAYGDSVYGELDGFDIDDDLIDNIENLVGSNGGDYLAGNAGANAIRGNDGGDQIYGRGGADRLIGGDGGDHFIYASAAEGGDRIMDFEIGGDKIVIVSDNFGGIHEGNIATAFQLSKSGLASGAGPKFVLDYEGADAGGLYYDADGGGVGVRVLIANLTFTTNPAVTLTYLSENDFLFV